MATELVTVLNPRNGKVGEISRRLFRIPSIGGGLIEVEPGTKSYNPELYTPKTPEEFKAKSPTKIAVPEKPASDVKNEKDNG